MKRLALPAPDMPGNILMRNCVLLLLLLSAPVMAQESPVETVTAHGSSLIGLWQIDTPRTALMKPGSKRLNWHPALRKYCRVEPDGDDLAATCLDTGSGSVRLDGDKVHFAWGSMFARMVLDATLVSSSRLEGQSAIKLAGDAIGSEDISIGTKLTLTPQMPDTAGRAALLANALAQLRDGALVEPHSAGSRNLQPPSAATLRTLGPVKTVSYLGDADDGLGTDKQRFIFSAYAVEFAQGERLCGLHQRADGVLDAFRCV